jgi:WD40 repeat protein
MGILHWSIIHLSNSQLVQGPTKSITASVLSRSPDLTFFTGSFDGAVKAFDLPSGSCRAVEGTGHSGKIVGLAIDDKNKDQIWSAAWGSPSLQLIKGNMFT